MRLVIIGGSDAGIAAALRAHELDATVEPLVVVADSYPNFSICGLPFYLSGETPTWQALAHRDRAALERGGMRLLLDHRATAIDAAAHRVTVDHAGGSHELGYDRLVVATGAEPVRPPIDGLNLDGVHVLHTVDHARAVAARLGEPSTRRVVVVGAGYIGLELADAFRHRGVHVTVVEMADRVLTTVDPPLSATIAASLRSHGVDVVTGTAVHTIERDGTALRVCADDVDRVADLVVVATGVRPATALAEDAGVGLGATGAIAVDRRMRTDVGDVLAAGDCVETWHALLERPAHLPLGTTAHKQGRVAGATAVGHAGRYAGSLGTQAVKLFDHVVARTGLREDEAAAAGIAARTVDVTTDDHKAYYPGATPLRLRLTAAPDGRLLGAQLLGHADAEVAKRCDVIALAIQHRLSVADVLDADLSYTPPLSAPWDAVQQAADAWLRAGVER